MKVAINKCYGGFSLSYEATLRYAELKGEKIYAYVDDYNDRSEDYNKRRVIPYDNAKEEDRHWCIHYATSPDVTNSEELNKYYWTFDRYESKFRSDPILIQVIEELGDKANGMCANLNIIEIPDDVKFTIEEYDGMEWIAETHQTWG